MAKNGSMLQCIIVDQKIIRQEAQTATRAWHHAKALLIKDEWLYARSMQAIQRSKLLLERVTCGQTPVTTTDTGQ